MPKPSFPGATPAARYSLIESSTEDGVCLSVKWSALVCQLFHPCHAPAMP